jgi:uncharacterized protein YeeX (DUF496 family)
MSRLQFNKRTIEARKRFILGEDYAYPALAGYLRDRIRKNGMSVSGWIKKINEEYDVRYSRCFVRNLEVSLHHRKINLGHFNIFARSFGEDIFDVFEFCAEWGKENRKKSLNL